MSKHLVARSGVLLVLLVALLGIQACSDDDPTAPPADRPPSLPDVATMTIDLSYFNSAQVDRMSIEKGGPPVAQVVIGKENFINAAVRLYFVELLFWAAIEPPVAAFALAIHSIPQLQSDGSWLWTYIYVKDEIEYRIFLYGTDRGDHTEWRMEVSTNNSQMPLDHFVWFAGEAMKNQSSGYWQFYEPILGGAEPAASELSTTPGVQSIRIDWTNGTGDSHELTVLNNMPGGENEGDRLVFSTSLAMSYVEFVDVSEPVVYNVTWYLDGSGSIEVPDYNNGEKACWDTHQNDVACSE